MNDVSDIINSIKATLYERVSNPLLSSFFISWLIWNYKFALIIMSFSIDTIEKIHYIKTTLFPFGFDPFLAPENGWTVLSIFIGPVTTAFIYLYVIYPMLGKKVYEDHKEHIKEYENIKVRIEGQTSMSEKDVFDLKSKLRTIEAIYSKQLDEKDSEINLLKEDINTLTIEAAKSRNQIAEMHKNQITTESSHKELSKLAKTNKDNEGHIEQLNAKITILSQELKASKESLKELIETNNDGSTKSPLIDEAKSILKIISKNETGELKTTIRNSIDIHRLIFDSALDSLIKEGYVTIGASYQNKETLIITREGEEYLIANRLI